MERTSKHKSFMIKIVIISIGFLIFTAFLFVSSPLSAGLKLTIIGLVTGIVIIIALWLFGVRSFLRAQLSSLFQGDYKRQFSSDEDTLYHDTQKKMWRFYDSTPSQGIRILITVGVFALMLFALIQLGPKLGRQNILEQTASPQNLLWEAPSNSQIVYLIAFTLIIWFLCQLIIAFISLAKNKPQNYIINKPALNGRLSVYKHTIAKDALTRDLKHYIRRYHLKSDDPTPLQTTMRFTVMDEIISRIFYVAVIVFASQWIVQQYVNKHHKALYTDHIITTGDYFFPTEPQVISFSELDQVILTCIKRTKRRRYSQNGPTSYHPKLRFYFQDEVILSVSPRKQYDVITQPLHQNRVTVKVGSSHEICRDKLKSTLKYMPNFNTYWKAGR